MKFETSKAAIDRMAALFEFILFFPYKYWMEILTFPPFGSIYEVTSPYVKWYSTMSFFTSSGGPKSVLSH